MDTKEKNVKSAKEIANNPSRNRNHKDLQSIDEQLKTLVESETRQDFENRSDGLIKTENEEEYFRRVVDDSNKYFLLKILSPEITKNEDKKRKHKDDLIKLISRFLIIQFGIVALLIIGTLTMIFVFKGLNNELSIEHIKVLFKYISIYITSVVVELIAMLKFVMENVFDTSITALVEFYKDKK